MPSPVLLDRSLNSVAQYLNTDTCNNNVFVLCGAGKYPPPELHSASQPVRAFPTLDLQIPANLAKLNLPYPEAVFDIHYFQNNPQPFYTLARDIAPGKFIPTPTHAFIRLLHAKGKLGICFTQNIDTLERIAGVPPEKIIEAHGSFASSRCTECKMPYDQESMRLAISEARVPHCEETGCDGLVKPDIVFFGEALPPDFIQAVPALRTAALVIIMGTSLKVHPFAMLPNLVPREGCPRLLLNLEPAGNIGSRPFASSSSAHKARHLTKDAAGGDEDSDEEEEDKNQWEDDEEEDEEEEDEPTWLDDVVHLGPCDRSVRELCDLLGWRDDLEEIWKELGGDDQGGAAPVPAATSATAAAANTNANHTPNNNGTTNTIMMNNTVIPVTDGDHHHAPAVNDEGRGQGKISGSIESEPDESATKWQRDQSDGRTTDAPKGQEGGDLTDVKDSSVEKTLGLIIQDMEEALKLSANDENDGDHASGKNK